MVVLVHNSIVVGGNIMKRNYAPIVVIRRQQRICYHVDFVDPVYSSNLDLTRFNKIAIPNNKFQMASGQGCHWLIESPTIFSSMCSPPLSDICQFYF